MVKSGQNQFLLYVSDCVGVYLSFWIVPTIFLTNILFQLCSIIRNVLSCAEPPISLGNYLQLNYPPGTSSLYQNKSLEIRYKRMQEEERGVHEFKLVG